MMMTFGSASLLHGDALDVLGRMQMEGRRFGAVLTDPPYSSGGNVRDRAMSTNRRYLQSGQRHVYPEFQGDTRDQRSYLAWSTLWMSAARDITEPGGIIATFSDWRQLPVTTDALQCAGWVWRGIVPWDKTEACRPQLGRYRTQCEYVVWGTNGTRQVAGKAAPGVFRAPIPRDKLHVAGKPVAVMTGLLSIMDGPILDPFAGSATVGAACLPLGLQYVGIEVDQTYFDVACGRLERVFEAQRECPK